MDVGRLQATIGADIDPLREALKEAARLMGAASQKVETEAEKMARVWENAGNKIKGIGNKFSLFLTTPLTAAGGAAMTMSIQFEEALDKIQGLVGASAEQTEQWAKDILRLSGEIGISAKELGDALYFITSAGIKGADAINVLEMSAKAAASGLGQTEVIADLVTSAMNAYGIANLNATQAMDILVASVREGKAAAPEMAASLGSILPIASNMGVSFDQVAGALAAMTRTGASASEASTSLRAILMAFVKPTKQAEEALMSLGSSSQEFRDILRNQGLLPALMNLKDLLANDTNDAISTVVPNIKALSGTLDLLGANLEANKTILENTAKAAGSFEKAYKIASEGAGNSLDRAIKSSSAALIEMGNTIKTALIPLIELWASAMRGISAWLNKLTEVQKMWIVSIGAALAALGPFLWALGSFISIWPNVVKGFKAIGTAITWMKTQLIAAYKWIVANPYLALAAAILAIGTAVYFYATKQTEAEKRLKMYDAAVKEATQDLAKEHIEMEQGIRLIQSYAMGTEDRKRAIDKLNQAYPSLLSNLDTEKLTNEQLEGILKKVNIAYEDKVKLAAINAKQQAATNEAIRLENEILSLMDKKDAAQIAYNEAVRKGEYTGKQLTWKFNFEGEEYDLEKINNQINKAREEQGKWNAEAKKYEFIAGFITNNVENTTISLEEQLKAQQEASLIEAQRRASLGDIQRIEEDIAKAQTGYAKARTHEERALFALQIANLEKYKADLEEVANKMNQGFKSTMVLPYFLKPMNLEKLQTEVPKPKFGAPIDATGMMEEFNKKLAENEELLNRQAVAMTNAGLPYDLMVEKINLYQSGLQALINDGYPTSNEAVQALIDKLKQLGVAYDSLSKKQQSIKETAERVGAAVGESAATMGERWIESLNLASDGMEGFLKIMLQTVTKLIAMALSTSIANAIQGASAAGAATYVAAPIMTPLFIAEMVGGVMAAFAAIPKFAEGALISGPTMGLMGEYAGASTNPEVIAPLDKLKNLIGGSSEMDITVHGKLIGEDLYISGERFSKRKNLIQ